MTDSQDSLLQHHSRKPGSNELRIFVDPPTTGLQTNYKRVVSQKGNEAGGCMAIEFATVANFWEVPLTASLKL
jgi:hypothetical protein